MPNQSALQSYKQNAVENAPPLKLVQMLYQGAIRFLDQALLLDPKLQGASFTERVTRADAIVIELRMSLRPEVAPELCAELERLYLFAEERLGQALERRSKEPLEEARKVLARLLDGWQNVQTDAA